MARSSGWPFPSRSLPARHQPESGGVVNSASFLAGIAPNSWITIFGTNLSPVTDTWANAIVNGNLPTLLDGVSVSVGGEPAYVYYVSPTQINAVTPNAVLGTTVTVTNSGETSSAANAAVQSFEPASSFSGGTLRSRKPGRITLSQSSERNPRRRDHYARQTRRRDYSLGNRLRPDESFRAAGRRNTLHHHLQH